MNDLITTIATALGASGIFSLIYTLIITRKMNQAFKRQDQREELQNENTFLMMARIDKLSETTKLMAEKLHNSGVINGDLKKLQDEYKELDDKYNQNMRHLALEYLKK